MPFISKDWRSPGEEWVKTQEGWEKKKVLECSAKLHSQRFDDISEFSNKTANQETTWPSKETGVRDSAAQVPPHCHITVKCTREIAGFNGLSEAVRRLDFASAVRDSRRFNYCCALLQLLVGGTRLTALPGAAQRVLLAMLEEVAMQVEESRQNIGALRALASALAVVREGEVRACWGRPLGSRALWRQHCDALARFDDIAGRANARAVEPTHTDHDSLHIHDLPEECVREILLRIADHRDLEASSAAWSVMASLCSEKRIWRELVHVHFTLAQIEQALTEDKNKLDGKVDWKTVYHSLRKQFGLREDLQYAETLSLCRHCKCLFWRSQGHPCIVDQCPEYRERLKEAGGPLPPHPIAPAAFLKFFSL